MSLGLLAGMVENEMEDLSETEEEREKQEKAGRNELRQVDDESTFLQREIIDAIRKSDEKMETYSRKVDEKMDTFLQTITDTVGTQLHGMNSTIAKMKEEDDRYKQISERIMNMEKKILDIDEKCENRSDEPRGWRPESR